MFRVQKNFKSSFRKFVFILLLGAVLFVCAAGAISLSPQDSQSSTSTTIAKGDPVKVYGVATGHPQNGLQVWLIGNNLLKVSTISVNSDNTYEYELKPADTTNMAGGQYFILIQHPMMNGQFDIVYNPATGEVTNRMLGSGTAIFQMSGTGSLQSPNSASALVAAINSQNIDDTFVRYSIFINEPAALISPIGDHVVGDKFTISGSTNLAVGDNLMVEITSSSFKPTQKSRDNTFSGAAGMVKVVPGSGGYNHWSFEVDASTFIPDEYIVTVKGITTNVMSSTTFNVLNGPVTTPYTIPVTTITTTLTTPVTTVPPTTIPVTQKASLPLLSGIAALVIVFVVRNR